MTGVTAMGATSVALAASFYFVPITETDGRVRWVATSYWVWIGSMVVVLVAPQLTRGDFAAEG